jgi:hypothetical protein
MRRPTPEEIDAARQMTQPFREQVNSTPALLSLLYDLDLMPEQIVLPVNAVRMAAVCELFKRLTPEAVAGFFKASEVGWTA